MGASTQWTWVVQLGVGLGMPVIAAIKHNAEQMWRIASDRRFVRFALRELAVPGVVRSVPNEFIKPLGNDEAILVEDAVV